MTQLERTFPALTFWRLRSEIDVVARAGLVAVLVLLSSSVAGAQSPALASVRESLASYDLQGDRTLGALRALSEARDDTGAEARFLRALVATDLVIAAYVEPSYEGVMPRLLSALSVAPAALIPHLREELSAVQQGVYRRLATEALDALAVLEAMQGQAAIDWTRPGHVRRDVLFLRRAADALEGRAPLAMPDPCASGQSCPDGLEMFDPAGRSRLALLLAASSSLARVDRAAREHDPLANALSASRERARARLSAESVHPSPAAVIGDVITLPAALPSPPPLSRLVVVGASDVRSLDLAAAGVVDGVLRTRAGEAPVRETTVRIGEDVREVDPAVLAVMSGAGGELAFSYVPSIPFAPVSTALRVADRAGVERVRLLARGEGGALGAHLLALVAPSEAADADIVLRARTGVVIVSWGTHSNLVRRPRVDGRYGFDMREILATIRRVPHQRVIVNGHPEMPARDVAMLIDELARANAAPPREDGTPTLALMVP